MSDSHASSQTPEARRTAKSIRTLKIAVVVLPILLIYGLWATQGEPLFPRLVGAGVNIYFTVWFIWLIRRASKLRQ